MQLLNLLPKYLVLLILFVGCERGATPQPSSVDEFKSKPSEELIERIRCKFEESKSLKRDFRTLVETTDTIFVGKLSSKKNAKSDQMVSPDFDIPIGASHQDTKSNAVEWVFEVSYYLKDKGKKKYESIFLDTPINPSDKRKFIPVFCRMLVNFNENSEYLIFKSQYHEKAYTKINPETINEIKSILGK